MASMTIPAMEMILPQGSSGNIPAFLAKLWKMVNNPEFDRLICWSDNGKSFIIKNQTEFASALLPTYYKHNNMASFVRQLNMYDFHKVMNVEVGGLRAEREEIEFAHQYFERGQEHLLEQIKRKVSLATKGLNQIVPVNTEKVSEVFTEVGNIRNRQEALDETLQYMRHENNELWKEVENLRDKHSRQQRIVNKLLQFLGAVVQTPSPGIGHKRKLQPSISMIQLALEGEQEESNTKEPKIEFPDDYQSTGPIIEELYNPPASDNGYQNVTLTTLNQLPPETKTVIQTVPAPASVVAVPVTTPTMRPVYKRQMTKEDIDLDINTIGVNLADMEDILRRNFENTGVVDNLFNGDTENVPTLYATEEGLCLQDGITISLAEPDSQTAGGMEAPTLVTYTPSQVVEELDLNTPLVQDESQDPMKTMMKRI